MADVVRIVLKDYEVAEFDETVANIDTWYDRHTRLWVIQMLNKDGYQIGDAEYVYGKQEARRRTLELIREYGL